ncbi:MAG: hypothetical protein ACOVSW_12595 [Candidatus Kapaibacteriota bacterium]
MATYKVFVTMIKDGSQTQRNYTVQADESYLKSVMTSGGDKQHLYSKRMKRYFRPTAEECENAAVARV